MTLPCPIMRYHGGKWRIADWVIGHFPPHAMYVEAFGGAGSVLAKKPRSRSEVYNDLDDDIVNVFRVLRDPESANELARQCALTPYARSEFDLAQEPSEDRIERARRTLFRAWASFGSAGATRGRTGFRGYYRPDGHDANVAHSWTRIGDIIERFADRFRDVVIENRPAIGVAEQYDHRSTLHYFDPPYLPETRSLEGSRYYRHEMSAEDHEDLLTRVQRLQGMIVLSGYDSPLYRETLAGGGWRMIELDTCGSSRMGSVRRTECLWLNPAAAGAAPQPDLFARAEA